MKAWHPQQGEMAMRLPVRNKALNENGSQTPTHVSKLFNEANRLLQHEVGLATDQVPHVLWSTRRQTSLPLGQTGNSDTATSMEICGIRRDIYRTSLYLVLPPDIRNRWIMVLSCRSCWPCMQTTYPKSRWSWLITRGMSYANQQHHAMKTAIPLCHGNLFSPYTIEGPYSCRLSRYFNFNGRQMLTGTKWDHFGSREAKRRGPNFSHIWVSQIFPPYYYYF